MWMDNKTQTLKEKVSKLENMVIQYFKYEEYFHDLSEAGLSVGKGKPREI